MGFVTVPLALALCAIALLLHFVLSAVHNVYFHPLAKYPGPTLWATNRIFFIVSFLGGKLPHTLLTLHEQYGDVVRTGPNALSFNGPGAWNDIHGHRNARVFRKDPDSYPHFPGTAPDLLNANDEDHSRFRRLLSHAFSDKALREQQPLLNGWVDKLTTQLRNVTAKGQACDLAQWYHCTTLDIVGDLAFGDDFGCLDSLALHPWIASIMKSLKALAYMLVILQFIPQTVLGALIPKDSAEGANKHMAMTIAKVSQRLRTQTTRSDFLYYILRHNDEKGMSEEEIISNASILLLAGSETTSTALSGTTYFLLRNPDTLAQLTHELRTTFATEDAMTVTALGNCKYLNAALREGIRLYPPVAIGLSRVVDADDAIVAGHHVPRGSTVSIPQYASHLSTANWTQPDRFDPARWLPGTQHPADRTSTFEPFSVGPRGCIGQNLAWVEMRLVLARVLYNFDLELSGDAAAQDAWSPAAQKVFVFWRKPALQVRLVPRR